LQESNIEREDDCFGRFSEELLAQLVIWDELQASTIFGVFVD
jgi:hypothetical protein